MISQYVNITKPGVSAEAFNALLGIDGSLNITCRLPELLRHSSPITAYVIRGDVFFMSDS